LKFDKKSELLGEVQLEVTQIQAGYQHNVVPDRCHYVIDVRTNEYYSNEEVYEIINASVNSEVNARSFRLRSSFIDPEHRLVKKAEAMGLQSFGSRTMSDQALIPAPSVKLGPGDSKISHKADEYILKDQIARAIDIYVELLTDLEL
jgi:acetylornithine deacetylase